MRADTTMNVLIVIVNYRTADLAIDCLRSIAPEVAAAPGLRAVVTDCRSGDDSIEKLREAIRANGWDDWAEVMPLEENRGFAYGNNAAIRPALALDRKPESILLLNPDTVVHPGAIAAMVDFLQKHPDAGIVGCRLEDPDGTPQRSAFRFHSIASELETALRFGPVTRLLSGAVVAPPAPETVCRADWLCGACMLVRREVFEQAGLLDEGYFMYYEETDFCLRARRAGWNCWYLPHARVVHLGGSSSGFNEQREPAKRRPPCWFESRRRYFVKNHGRLYAAAADVVFATGYLLWRCRRAIQRKPDGDPPNLLSDMLRHSVLRRPSPSE